MKLLYLMSGFPDPPRGGGPLRIVGLLHGAAQAGHEVHVMCLADVVEVRRDTPFYQICASVEVIPPPIRSKSSRLKTLLTTSQADMQTRIWSQTFWQALQTRLNAEHFDLIQFQSLEMGIYLPLVCQMNISAKLVYDAYNAEADLQHSVYLTERRNPKRWLGAAYSWIQWRRLGRFERALCQTADAVIAVSTEDQRLLSGLSSTPVYLVNNGISSADYAQSASLSLNQPALVFTGIMDYRPNVDAVTWFADEILPHLDACHFYIVGGRPHARVQALAEHPNITVTGFVEEVTPYLHAGAVFVVPLRMGSGTRLKLLQAMSAGCAIISTPIGAMGLDVIHGREMLLAAEATEFAEGINRLLRNPNERAILGATGQAFVRQYFDWSVIVPRLLAAYAEITASRP